MVDQKSGLYAGFEGYRSPTQQQLRQVLTTGIVVPDTNLLLNLYRYTATARDALLKTLEKLPTLWVPHQVLAEFWRNRETVLRDPGDATKITKSLEKHQEDLREELRAWSNRVNLTPEERDALIAVLDKGFTSAVATVSELASSSMHKFHHDTNQDSVLAAMEPILDGRVGPRLAKKAHDAAVAEGRRRTQASEPPGYKDKKKDDAKAVGDYLVWEQTLVEATDRGVDVLFVTGDTKEDWWREEGGQRRGPRVELVDEMQARCGTNLYMIRPAQLLELAKAELDIDVSFASMQEIERVNRYLSALGASKDPQETHRNIEKIVGIFAANPELTDRFVRRMRAGRASDRPS
ncbi:hypothetical protein JOD54_000939 [Actinokineospora baliensis]|uniref:PIN-like domain-containing protein n=1 Tax=Actinokineospora baliensis TaxID=547056 RepID=UPI00195CE098|nr:PIN-like domain-containing protein [Actinokineospora baliensis]MBM7770735.1 hypothetical protein [Actinokineospora baliensis]